MMNKMVVANLVHRPTRSFIAASAIALEVVMILMVVALFYGLLNGSKESQLGTGADLMVMPPGASSIIGLSGAPIPIKVGDKLRQVPHVASAVPAVWWFTSKPIEIIYGIDVASYDTLPPKFRYLSGGPFQGPYDVIVDDYFADMNHKKVGDTIDILSHDFRISGIVPHGKGCRKCLPLETLQDLVSAQGHASVFYVKVDDPANADQVEKAIEAIPGMEKYSVRSMPEFLSTMTPDNLPGFDLAIKIVIGVAVVVGFLVIFQSMYTAVMERTREIGILKSLGASKWYIVNVVLRETVLLAVVGIVAGILISLATRHAIMFEKPVLRLFWSNEWVLRASVIAVVGALAGALYPALKAAQRDPIDALAYE
ncbi:MAG TPA: FtsX-like permease family protein [Candidatus Sulfotelmatobacter sp.]|nr:FtsX-like permease family protein [Candidatus Sulfotelmatobacter sp.]